MFTRPYRKANQKAEKVRNIMSVLGISYDEEMPARELLDRFQNKVDEQEVSGLTVYEYMGEGQDGNHPVAVLFTGSGVWGPIKGVLALEPDLQTIRGISFYEQEETPGLGGEISTPAFKEQFIGKKIMVETDGQEEAGMKVTPPGQASGPREVDGITGATMTSDRVELMLNQTIKTIVSEVRGNV
jgi:Na+-transporting NADH:ubiquinone oxidoreductase subunit C